MQKKVKLELDNIETGHDKFVFLRNRYPEFIYDKFEYEIDPEENILKIKFVFIQMEIIDNINNNSDRKKLEEFTRFTPTLKLSLNTNDSSISNTFPNLKNTEILEKIIFNIGMIELISYWKACVSPKIIIKPKFVLTNRQLKFWKDIYSNGLGEYIYVNQIIVSQKDIFEIIPFRKQKILDNIGNNNSNNNPKIAFNNSSNIIPIGGGKDSIVSIELLRDFYTNKSSNSRKESFYKENYAIILNPREATLKTAEITGFEKNKIIIVKRTIDKNLLILNENGFLNGHTPFSALLAFVTSLVSFTYGIKNIILSNEDSASEANVTFNNLEINHQYSKSFDAEKELNWYIKKYLHSSINYFSLLRPLYEIQIASLFSDYASGYFNDFRSCNAGSKKNIWCLKCPKCLFVFIILSPFIPLKTLEKEIFGENLLDKLELENIFLELLGMKNIKPFECVGTYEEVQISLFLLNEKLDNVKSNSKEGKDKPILLKRFLELYSNNKNTKNSYKKNKKYLKLKKDSSSIFKHFNEENLLPKKLSNFIKTML